MLASFFGEIALIPTFELFGKTFGIYPVLALVGIFTAGIYACRQARKKGLDENDMIMVLLVSAVGVLLGGHLLYGLVNVLSAPGSAPNLLASDSPKAFFENAPRINPASSLIKGVVCGIRVEEIQDPLMQKIRYMDKLIDELAKGKALEKILRS